MKKSGVWAAAAALLMAMLVGGCGDAPYELTTSEEAIIVNYSAHIVTKYNTLQAEGLTFVFPTEETETEERYEGTDAGAEAEEPTEQVPQDPVVEFPSATLDEVFGQAGISLRYVGARLATNFTQDDYYALYPDEGMQYLVIGIDVINTETVPASYNMLNADPQFKVLLRGDVSAKAERTMLLDDFTVLEAVLAPGETRETVVLFQVPADTYSLEAMVLTANNGTGNYQIILE